MKLESLLNEVNIIKNNADTGINVSGICYDSRALRSGEIFVAITGYETDGHKYINDAISKGAVCVICEKEPEASVPYVLVEDSRKALASISAVWFGYPAKKMKLIGVTGTNGKTSVTNLIKHILKKCTDDKIGLIGTNGNFIGERELPAEHTTPESYEMHKLLDKMVIEGCKYVVMEVSSHALFLDRVYGIKFDIGVFTNLTPDHLDFHDTMDDYADAKSILFQISEKSIINIDDIWAQTMAEKAAGPVISYAVNNSSADLVGKDIKLLADRIEFCVLSVGSINRVELQIPGMFSVYNALASIAAVVLLGFDINDITPVLQSYHGVKGRVEVIPTGCDFTVLVDYAHTPDALSKIITAVRGFAKNRVVTVFGCGGDRDKIKRPLMGQIAVDLSDYAIITSDNPRTENPADIIFSPDPYFDDNPAELRVIAHKLFKYKDKMFAPDDIKKVTDAITDELTRLFNIRLPDSITKGREVYFTTIMVLRKHIPKKRLVGLIFPILADPEQFKTSIILPKHYWAKDLCRNWKWTYIIDYEILTNPFQ